MSEVKPIKIAFFEVEPWEEEYFAGTLEPYQMTFFHDPLEWSLIDGVKDANIISIFIRSQLTGGVLELLPDLSFIATRSTGYDHIDMVAAKERQIIVSNVPRYGETTVAEHTFGLILSLSRKIYKAHVRTTRGDFSLQSLEGFDLRGKTLGVVGAGSIGLHVIRIGKGFAMNVLAYDLRPNDLIAEVLGFEYVPLAQLLSQSDVITLHAPYNQETHHMINRDSLMLVKRGAILINTARGGLVDTAALLWALDEGILSGAGLDVVEGEEFIDEEKQLLNAPAAEDQLRAILRQYVLLRREDVVVTPHMGFYSREALQRIVEVTAANIKAFLLGNPQNVVSA